MFRPISICLGKLYGGERAQMFAGTGQRRNSVTGANARLDLGKQLKTCFAVNGGFANLIPDAREVEFQVLLANVAVDLIVMIDQAEPNQPAVPVGHWPPQAGFVADGARLAALAELPDLNVRRSVEIFVDMLPAGASRRTEADRAAIFSNDQAGQGEVGREWLVDKAVA